MKWTLAGLLLPEEVLPVLLVLAGLLMVIGMKRVAVSLVLFVIGMALLPMIDPFIEAVVALLPVWVLIVVLVGVGMALLRVAATVLLGRGATDNMIGILMADLVKLILLLPFRALRVVFRLFIPGRTQ